MQRLCSLQYRRDDDISWLLSDYHHFRVSMHSALDYLRISYPTLRPSWFSDASTAAFAVAVYLRIININGSITVFLLAAKSKVCPLLKLSASRDWDYPLHCFSLAWCISHSAIQLSSVTAERTPPFTWLSQSPSRWKTFVANRVSLCNYSFPKFRGVMFRHTPIPQIVHRGLALNFFRIHALWWSGPPWLYHSFES